MNSVVYNGRIEDIASHSFLKHVFGDKYQHTNRYGMTGPNHINFWTCHQWWDNSNICNYTYTIDFRNDVYKIVDKRMDSKIHGLNMCKHSFTMNVEDFKNSTGDVDDTRRDHPDGNKLIWESSKNFNKVEPYKLKEYNLRKEINYLNDDFKSILFELTVYTEDQYHITRIAPIKFINKDSKLLENVYLNFLDSEIFITIVVLKDTNGVYAYNIYAGDTQETNDNFKFFQNDKIKMNVKITIEN